MSDEEKDLLSQYVACCQTVNTEGVRLRARIMDCVQACDGIETPLAAIGQARMALHSARTFVRAVVASDVPMSRVAEVRDKLDAALAALTPKE